MTKATGLSGLFWVADSIPTGVDCISMDRILRE
jgi:hypothetical protein